jgi:hypothetical protein
MGHREIKGGELECGRNENGDFYIAVFNRVFYSKTKYELVETRLVLGVHQIDGVARALKEHFGHLEDLVAEEKEENDE